MKKDINDLLEDKVDIEEERQILGAALYKVQDDLPSIIIDDESIEEWIQTFYVLKNICDQFGSDMTSIFAELTILHEIKELSDIKDEEKEAIRLTYLIIRGLLTHAMNQAQQNIDFLQTSLNNEHIMKATEINGSGYYFIPIILNNLLSSYTTLICFMMKKVYLNSQFIDSIRERVMFLVSPEFEEIRMKFKVAECWDIKRKSEENKITLH